MSNDIEYIEPTQEHVGQMVEVRDGGGECWKPAKLTAIIECDSDNSRFVAKKQRDCYSMSWQFARITRPLTYAERQARCGLKVGDRVRFTKAWDYSESCYISYISAMDDYIGKVGTIGSVGINGIDVKFSKLSLWLPYFVLEKVEGRVATRRDIDAAVYVDGNPQDVFTLEHWYSCDNQPCRAVVRSGDKRFVYELSNLRVKE